MPKPPSVKRRIVGRRRILKKISLVGTIMLFEDRQWDWRLKVTGPRPLNLQGSGCASQKTARVRLQREFNLQLGTIH